MGGGSWPGVAEGYATNPANKAIGWRLDGTEIGDPSPAIYVAYNAWSGALTFTLPSAGAGKKWNLVGDTCDGVLAEPGMETLAGASVSVCARGLALLVAK